MIICEINSDISSLKVVEYTAQCICAWMKNRHPTPSALSKWTSFQWELERRVPQFHILGATTFKVFWISREGFHNLSWTIPRWFLKMMQENSFWTFPLNWTADEGCGDLTGGQYPPRFKLCDDARSVQVVMSTVYVGNSKCFGQKF